MTEQQLPDQAARDRIRDDTDATLFVNAGAGSGKTQSLLDRIVTLVLRDEVPLRAIAAVTFTEKAGAELRDRLRARLEAAQRQQRSASLATERVDEALDDLDAAAIGTLHSFAQRILTEHPIEAGLPPMLEVLDEVGSSVAFDDRWSALQRELLDDDEVAEALLLGMACGVQLKHIRSLARLLGSDWDLIESHVLAGDDEPVMPPELDSLAAQAARIGARADECLDDTDKLLPKIQQVAEYAERLGAAADDGESRLTILQELAGGKFGVGRKGSWPDKEGLQQECRDLVAMAHDAVGRVLDGSLRALTRWTGRRVLAAAEERRAEGRLEFHDLLVLARDLLRHNADVRAALHERYQRLLLDEFQDTDPIQIELAVRIAAGEAAGDADWRDVDVPAGRIFVVGDPKQSIYRFRRANIAVYLDAEQRLGETVSLTTNFRTVAPTLDWVNRVFGELIQPACKAQPAYEALDRHRGDPPAGPAVTVLGADAHADLPKAASAILREREAADVAAVVLRALREGWQVYDEHAGCWRAARRDDIAILVPARTSLPFLEDALDSAGIPYRAEASSLVYQAAEVRSLLACARSIADSTDGLSLLTALRSPLFGCGDDDLWRWKHAGGSISIHSRPTKEEGLAGGPVGNALDYLRRLSFEARWLTPSEVLGAIVADRRMLEVAATGPRERDAWRRLRFVVDQARAWSEVSHGGLRAYLAWASRQGQEGARVAEAVLPETDADAVKVMTIHAAKGLEFPIVVLSGMTSAPYHPGGVRLLWNQHGFAVKFGKDLETDDFEAAVPIDEQMDELEKHRLLYVAATRARDHLVVSLHRADKSSRRTAAQVLADAGAGTDGVDRMPAALPDRQSGTPTSGPDHDTTDASGAQPDPGGGVTAPPDWDAWLADLDAIRARARRPAAISASGLEGTEPEIVLAAPPAHGIAEQAAVDQAVEVEDAAALQEVVEGAAKGARDVELPPWTKGRYGSAVGRAVHAVLQGIDLATGAGLDNAVASQCLAEGVADQAHLVRVLVCSALDSEVVKRAAVREHWRETYVGTVEDDGTVLEGFVDLAYREDDGTLVIVDYKTDAIPTGALESRIAYYRPQLDAYVKAHRDAVDVPVRATLLFLTPGAAVPAQPSR